VWISPPETSFAADGWRWAEFENYYFDADMAADIWEAAYIAASSSNWAP